MPVSGAIIDIILGPTASGKESSAFAIARKCGAEIVSVDSMKIYRGLDIGTAKATQEMRAKVAHHCLDIADTQEDFSVARYQQAADAAIARIATRGGRAILSGGTALYYKAVLEGLFEAPLKDELLRARLREFAAQHGKDALYSRLAEHDPQAAAKLHPNDLRRVVRALEIIELTGAPISARQQQWSGFHGEEGAFAGELRYRFRMARLDWPREELYRRIEVRVARMLEEGLEAEARLVYDNRDTFSRTPLQAVGYKEFFPYFSGECGLTTAVEELQTNTRHLAKSQCTWFNKFPATPAVLQQGMSADDVAATVEAALERAPVHG